MDPYIIDNMPDDDGEPSGETSKPEADVVLRSADLLVTVHNDGVQYVLSVGTAITQMVPMAAFDPTVPLQVVLSLLITLSNNETQPVHMSAEAIAALDTL